MKSMPLPVRLALAVCLTFAATRAGAQCPTAASSATQQSPAIGTNFASGAPVAFQWNAATAPGVVAYEVYVSKVGSGTTTSACFVNAPATSCTANGLADGEWEWVVNTKTSTCTPGVDSGKRTFTLGCGLATPTISSPSDQSTNVATTVTLN